MVLPLLECTCHGEVLIAIVAAIRNLDANQFADLLRVGEFDMVDGVICHISRFDPVRTAIANKFRWERLVCPWDASKSRDEGKWKLIA